MSGPLLPSQLGHGVFGVRHAGHTPIHAQLRSRLLAAVNFLDGTKIEQQRVLLAVYPLLCVCGLKTCMPSLTKPFQVVLFPSCMDDTYSIKCGTTAT